MEENRVAVLVTNIYPVVSRIADRAPTRGVTGAGGLFHTGARCVGRMEVEKPPGGGGLRENLRGYTLKGSIWVGWQMRSKHV